MLRLYFIFLLLLSGAYKGWSQDSYTLSPPLGLDEVGINKVLCLKNGNTILFHFEINKPIKTYVFDSACNRLFTSSITPQKLDIFMLTTSAFKGMYEINEDAVLFFEQQNSGRHALIRLRFDGKTGKLIEEETMGRSKSMAKPTRFFVVKHKHDTGYQILYSQDAMQFQKCDVHLKYYTAHHKLYRDVPLIFDRKKYHFMNVTGVDADEKGTCITLGLSNLLVNGTGNTVESSPIYDHYLQVFYIPRDSTLPLQRTADLSTEIIPYYTTYTHNPFAGTINLMMLSYKDAVLRYGIEMRPAQFINNLLFKFDEQTLEGKYSWLNNKLANNWLKEQTDTTNYFSGFPLKMMTNSNGLSTVISESYNRYINTETYSRSQVFETYLGNICITQFDDDGNEIWGRVLPKSQYYKSYRHYYRPLDMNKKWQQQAMFNDLPPQIYERQFMSANVCTKGDDIYIVYNDCGKNFSNNIAEPGDTVFTSALSNACYYRMNKKKEITKHYLMGQPMTKEYKSCFIEGSDFDEPRGRFASVVKYKRSGYVSLRMVWATLQ